MWNPLQNIGSPNHRPLSRQSSAQSDKSNKSEKSSNTPILEKYSNNPERYANAMEKHFGHDMGKLYAHVKDLSEAEQRAIIDGSKAFRGFLGIRDPNRLSRKLYLSSSSSRIPDNEAPAALVMAATRSSNNDRVMRSLDRLRESLGNITKNRGPNRSILSLIAPPLKQLAKELNKLETEDALKKAVLILENNKFMLDKETVNSIESFSKKDLANRNIDQDLKERLNTLGNMWVDESLFKNAEIHQEKRANDRQKVRLSIGNVSPKNSPSARPQGETSSSANRNFRSDRLAPQNKPVSPPEVSAEITTQIKASDLKKIRKLDEKFFEYAEKVVQNGKCAALEKNHLPLIAQMENDRNSGLNLHVFDNAQKCHSHIAKMQSDGTIKGHFRFVYPPYSRMSQLYIALDVKLQPGEPASITAYDEMLSSGGHTDTLKKMLPSQIPNSNITFESDQERELHRSTLTRITDYGDSMMVSLDKALKSFRPDEAQTSTSVDNFRLQRIKGVQDYLSQKKKS